MSALSQMTALELVTSAANTAEALDGMNLPRNAAIVRELCARLVPIKVALTVPVSGQKAWCEQCDMLVALSEAANCKSKFCGVSK